MRKWNFHIQNKNHISNKNTKKNNEYTCLKFPKLYIYSKATNQCFLSFSHFLWLFFFNWQVIYVTLWKYGKAKGINPEEAKSLTHKYYTLLAVSGIYHEWEF